jgi:hypothetical protein
VDPELTGKSDREVSGKLNPEQIGPGSNIMHTGMEHKQPWWQDVNMLSQHEADAVQYLNSGCGFHFQLER